MGDVKDNIDDVLDVHHMVVSNMVKNKELMNRVRIERCFCLVMERRGWRSISPIQNM